MGFKGFTRVLLAAILVASIALSSAPLTASADAVTDAQARLQIINKIKGSLTDNLTRAQAQEIALRQQLQETQDAINQTLDRIAATEREIATLVEKIAALQAKIAETRLQLIKLKREYSDFVRATYKSNADPVALMLGAPSFQAFLNRAVAIEHLTFLSKHLMDRIKQTELDLKAQQTVVEMDKKTADHKRDDLLTQKAALDQQQAKQKVLQQKLLASIAQVKTELTVINGQSVALAQRIADLEIARQDQLIAEAEQAAWQQAQFWMQNNLFTLPGATGTHSTKYQLVWPMQQGTITQLFGPSTLPFEPPGFGFAHFHAGVDVSAPQGSPIVAADDGVVVAAASSTLNGVLVGYGNYIIVAHRNNYFSLYGHLLGYAVKAGESVHQGQVIGAEGSTGNSTGPHVHFEYRYGGQPTNPLPYLPPNGPNGFNQ